MDSRPIGIFDSGVGGLTVLAEIKRLLPQENIVYIGDTKNFPYGNKSKDKIIEYSIANMSRLIKENVKAVVIACGTATSQALKKIQTEFDIPIIGIIEPTVKYVKQRNIKKIGVIATEGTIKSNAWEIELKSKIEDIEVINKACPMLATIAEEGRALGEEGRTAIKEYMEPFKKNQIDKIILGCTHYPIYERLIKEELQYEVELINTGITVASDLKELLKKKNMENENSKMTEKIILTKPEPYFKNIAKNILEYEAKIN